MISTDTFKQKALSFPVTTEQPHFDKISFRVKKKIFATLDENTGQASLKLTPLDQSVFCAFDNSIVYPANGAWGTHGWTIFELNKVNKGMIRDALKIAYRGVASKKSNS